MKAHPVYFIPAGDYFGESSEKCYLVYSPLVNKSFLVLPEEKDRLSALLEKNETDDAVIRQILPDQARIDQFHTAVKPEMTSIEFLLNERCNFSCSYCYSAGSRSSAEIDMPRIRTALQFIHSCAGKLSKENVTVTFIGGGEPLLSWNLIEDTVAYSEDMKRQDGISTKFVLVTNGSLFTEEQIVYCREKDFDIQFSFEILERIQNLQRQSFEEVSGNLKKALKARCNVFIRSTITEDNVDLLPEMAETCLKEYPEVRLIGCEPVTDAWMEHDLERVRRFYERYFESYRKACRLLDGSGLTISSSASRAINHLRHRFCGPMFCLQTTGAILACSHFSSPDNPGFREFRYGQVEDGNVCISESDLRRIYGDALPEECDRCWARWNCGGGCGNQRYMYSREVFDIICEERRKILLFEVLRSLEKQYAQSTGKDFVASIRALITARNNS